MQEAGIYVHFPFCKSRCDYCDFNTCAGMERQIPLYCKSLQKEIELTSPYFKNDIWVRSIYLGGGTPSYLSAENLRQIIRSIRDNFHVCSDVEISMEANPADVCASNAAIWYASGINRLSIGMQSAHEAELAMLGRRHRWREVQQAVQMARRAGFANINLDIMFGLPGQSMQHWTQTLEKALSLVPSHLSVYALIVEEGTPLAGRLVAGQLPAIDEDLAGDMYEWVMEALPCYGFEQYEISNWAKQQKGRDFRCQHNLLYWRNGSYLGLGASAHSHHSNQRWSNIIHILEYIQSVYTATDLNPGAPPFPWGDQFETLSLRGEMADTAMMGLRLVKEGLRDDVFIQKFNQSLFEVYREPIEELSRQGLLVVDHTDGGSIHLTKRGCMLGNQVFYHFLAE